MSFPLRKSMKSEPSQILAAKGILYHDWEAVTPCQRESTSRFGMTIQMEQEAYLSQHPEIDGMLQSFISHMTNCMKHRTDLLKETAEWFLRDPEIIDKEIRTILGVPETGPYTKEDLTPYECKDVLLENELKRINEKYYSSAEWHIPSSEALTINTESSSFLSINTSDSTLPTPEPVKTPEPTLSEVFFSMVSNTVDKAVYGRLNDEELRYDTAYVELTRAVEQAMEIPVLEIREDIANLWYNAYKLFEINIQEKERIAAEMAWEKRMRKKMKRTLRRAANFKGYETPPTPKSEVSSHESYTRAPPRPCKCHPQWNYNRHKKDRFGIYLPTPLQFEPNNTTVTPAISLEHVNVETESEGGETKSAKSGKSSKSQVNK